MSFLEMIKTNKVLDLIHKKLIQDFDLFITVGIEIEFYLLPMKEGVISYQKIVEKFKANFPYLIESEMGRGQFEIILSPSSYISYYAEFVISLKKRIEEFCRKLNYLALFTAKPFPNDFGNSMQINLSFNDFENRSRLISNILCSYVLKTKNFFLPTYADYKRLDSNFMSPTHICPGSADNRTSLIRLLKNRIEHRLPSANANPYEVLYAILTSIYSGLSDIDSIKNFPIIYGNAFDAQYQLFRIIHE